MRILITTILFALAFRCPPSQDVSLTQQGSPRIKVEFRVAEAYPARGLIEARIANSDQKVYLHKQAVITNKDILGARVIESAYNRHDGDIEIAFTREGGTRMSKTTSRHIGKLLAVIIDGKVISAPKINATFSDKCVISGHYTRGEAEGIASGINRR